AVALPGTAALGPSADPARRAGRAPGSAGPGRPVPSASPPREIRRASPTAAVDSWRRRDVFAAVAQLQATNAELGSAKSQLQDANSKRATASEELKASLATVRAERAKTLRYSWGFAAMGCGSLSPAGRGWACTSGALVGAGSVRAPLRRLESRKRS